MRGKPFVERKGYSKLEATDDLYVSSSMHVSASGKIRNIEFPEDSVAHLNATNSDLILSSSSTSKVVISGTIVEFTDDAVSTYANIVNRSSHLILSSSVGSNVIISGTVGTIPWTVATVSTGSYANGQIAYVSDGAAGSACLAVWNGTDWKRIVLGDTIDDSA